MNELHRKPTARVDGPPRRLPHAADPYTMVIFGGSGDLTHRLLMPALYNLAKTNLLPERFALIGLGTSDRTSESWGEDLLGGLKRAKSRDGEIPEPIWQGLAARMEYLRGDLNDPALYTQIGAALEKSEARDATEGNAIFYLAVADRFFETIVDNLGTAGLTQQNLDGDGKKFWRRVVIEKPFGHSLSSARLLNDRILQTLKENQIFRIDH